MMRILRGRKTVGLSFPAHFTDENKRRVGDPSRASSPRETSGTTAQRSPPLPTHPSPSLTQKPSCGSGLGSCALHNRNPRAVHSFIRSYRKGHKHRAEILKMQPGWREAVFSGALGPPGGGDT